MFSGPEAEESDAQREEEDEEDVWRRRCVVFINTVTGEAQAHSVRTERLAERDLHRMDATWTRPRAQALRLSRWTLTAAMDHRTRRLKHLHPAPCARLPSLRLTCAVLGRRGLWDGCMGGWVDLQKLITDLGRFYPSRGE